MPIDRNSIRERLKSFAFQELFTQELGWDFPTQGLPVTIGDAVFNLESVAEKRGVRIFHCPPDSDGRIPLSDIRRKIDREVRKYAHEHLIIYTNGDQTRQLWQYVAHRPGKPAAYRELEWLANRDNELLLQKLEGITFTLDQEEELTLLGVVQRLTDNVDRDRVTKRFYDRFKREKDAFSAFIEGLEDAGLHSHYTSLMLNRFMFCYFLQRKGFLDGDRHYLSNRLESVRERVGEEQFHSFYRSFLRRLFHEGLDEHADSRSDEIRKLIGDIPYLNGGLFEEHHIERDHPDIHIPDEAFEQVFAFFDQYDWHLDDRPIAEGNEINPEVLGYVFEKYTNQKQMGAYYTKEDITEYISKNCIIPFLFDSVRDKLDDAVWQMAQDDPDRYIYPAVGHGTFIDYYSGKKLDQSLPLPDYIEKGIDTETPDLLERRERWNEAATRDVALPTEIWRETVARRMRCAELQQKLYDGEVRSINHFITLNLDIRRFAQDVVENAEPELLSALFKAIRKVSVLDPTCGSGAFLFAALEILEPLYRASLDRMRALLDDWKQSGEKRPNFTKQFKEILEAAARHPNEEYFILKSIIVHNLYGVDIMEEAVEICKLRLFLKLASQLEPDQPVEPLPDIDFNIRSGNTLVGYASLHDLDQSTVFESTGQMRMLDEDQLISKQRIIEQAEDVDSQFRLFQDMQDEFGMDAGAYRAAKQQVEERLTTLRNQLDRFLAADYDQRNVESDESFETWRDSHEPFHWFVEFYGIINGGGFDVIIGNPPYVESSKIKRQYSTQCSNLRNHPNTFGLITERAITLLKEKAFLGFIVPLSLVCTPRTVDIRRVLRPFKSWLSMYDMRPSALFTGVAQRLTVALFQNFNDNVINTGGYRRWKGTSRDQLFELTSYSELSLADVNNDSWPKIEQEIDRSVLSKLTGGSLERIATKQGRPSFYIHRIVRYFIKAVDFIPLYIDATGIRGKSEDYKVFSITGGQENVANALYNSTLFYWFWRLNGDGFHCGYGDVFKFPMGEEWSGLPKKEMEAQNSKLMNGYRSSSEEKSINTKGGEITFEELSPKLSKPIIDEIDKILAEHYGFTDEELDFIINYDIKYRLGLDGA